MITRTLIDKSTTIKSNSDDNFGLNPICYLSYGGSVTRALIHFDIENLKEKYLDIINGVYGDKTQLKHIIKFKNGGNIDFKRFKLLLPNNDINGVKERATSFKIVAYKVNHDWDEGIGFDNTTDFFDNGYAAVSKDGCTWYNCTTEKLWDEDGIYKQDFLIDEYNNYIDGKESIIVGSQNFDHGNEDLEIDITDYVNNLITGEETNYGLCLSMSPILEDTTRKRTQYVAFFNNKTNTVYEPVLETHYDSCISDDRMSFYLNKENKLYLYSFINGVLTDLDYPPICEILDEYYESKKEMTGIYSITLTLRSNQVDKDTVVYDTWKNLFYKGEHLDDVMLEFVTHSQQEFFGIGNKVIVPKVLNPMIVGINDNEKITRDENRLMKVFFKVPYTKSDFQLVDNAEYRLYLKDGQREVDVIEWDKIMKMDVSNFFMIDTTTLVPGDYHLDIKGKFGNDIRVFKDVLKFSIISNVTKHNL